MSYLKKFELTNEGKALSAINIPPNDQGDEGMYFQVSKLTDRRAELLFNRKDGRGKRFVKMSSATAKKSKD